MQKNDVIRGFRVEYVQELPEIGARLVRMTYEKNGADLIWLDRKDDNKTFAIAFKTIPSDHTGVFHILEHSVLNGSEKYPVKEPFVELIKGSMATFLNAFTFPDKTMYPVCSRNPQDFLNLIDVYMDAVLHPLSIKDPHAFRQEGWHYELDSPEGELKCNGVVYNEMKGAYATYDSVLSFELQKLLFPDNCYGFESGGHPDHIPELTYENYLANHHRFYHPSNARIILDGAIDVDAVLSKLDSFLCKYDRLDVDADIPYQKPVSPEEKTAYYEIGAEEDDSKKAILAEGWVVGDYSETEKTLALSVISSVLADYNESPLTKALLDAGLAEDVSLRLMDGIQQNAMTLVIRNVDPAKEGEIRALVEKVLREQAKGMDKKLLHSNLSRMEFATREKDFGGMPRGLVYAMTTLESWLYGGDPSQNLCNDAVFASLRKKIDEGWFEKLLEETLINNTHRAKLCLLPSKTLGEEKRAAEAARLKEVKKNLSAGDIERIISEFALLRSRQEAADTEEQLKCLPRLSVSDIPEKCETTPQEVLTAGGVTVLHQPLETNGIIYLNLYFPLSDLPAEKLGKAAFMASVIGQTATENYSVLELSGELQGKLGRFYASTEVFAECGQTAEASPYVTVRIALLESSKEDAVRLADEILNRSNYLDKELIYNLLRQSRLSMEQRIAMRGDSYGTMRANAASSAKGLVIEATQGISMLRDLQNADNGYNEHGEEFCRELADIAKHVFTKSKLTVGYTGEYDAEWLEELLSKLSEGEKGENVKYQPKPVSREGFVIPAEIGFAVKASNLGVVGAEYSGAARVAAQFLTYDYLWNDIRVKGGAYGTHMNVRAGGGVSLTSYRDPSPARSLTSFDKAGQVLRDFCESKGDIEKYIISTIAAIEPVLTPRSEGDRAAEAYFSKITPADLQRERSEILGTTFEQLEGFSRVLDEICSAAGVCVVGGKNVIDACGSALDKVEAV